MKGGFALKFLHSLLSLSLRSNVEFLCHYHSRQKLVVEVELHKKGKRKKVLSLRLLTVQCSPFVGYFYGSVILSLSVSIHSYPAGRQKIDIIPPRKQH